MERRGFCKVSDSFQDEIVALESGLWFNAVDKIVKYLLVILEK